jgi:endo-1,4-beta-xylanase
MSDRLRAAPSSSLVASFDRPQSLPEPNPNAGTLRAYASRIGLYFGSMADSMAGNGWETASVRNTLGSEFNLMVPGNQLKWFMTEPTQDTFDFAPGDLLVDFAIAYNMKVRGHNLLWGMANPDWLGNGPARTYKKFTGQQLEAILVNHIRIVIGHYRDKYPGVVKWWDVTNEVMGWNNKFNSDGILWTNIGISPDRADYLRVAFRTARAADPNAILCMNDWGNEGSVPDRTQNMIDTVKAFKAEGIPIDCVGMEAHLDSESAPTYKQVLKVMKAYADIGVQVQVTEFDIQAPRSAQDWNKASTIATNILKACVDSPNCTAFNNWGFSQAFYINDAGNQNTVTMLPWDTKNQISPEYTAMRTVLESVPR